ncbi:MAG: hypothetical protein R3B40_15480 [Polyangiales bacterium]|nr:hypothetical protein [Myxococcales bacterium]MCB9658362.1 hypothetical protein [Sandaracinaceae bacterium]
MIEGLAFIVGGVLLARSAIGAWRREGLPIGVAMDEFGPVVALLRPLPRTLAMAWSMWVAFGRVELAVVWAALGTYYAVMAAIGATMAALYSLASGQEPRIKKPTGWNAHLLEQFRRRQRRFALPVAGVLVAWVWAWLRSV